MTALSFRTFARGLALILAASTLHGSTVTAAGSRPVEAPSAGAAPVMGPDRAIETAELTTFLDGAMASEFQSRKLAGAAIVIVKDGRILFRKGYGFGDVDKGAPVDPARTRFTVGSISKLFVWTAIMQLVEQGKLDLDGDVNRYLRKFQIPATYSTPITVRNLLTHSAGFEDKGAPFAPAIAGRYADLGDFLAAHLPRRVAPPARDFAHVSQPYSNWGALLAGHVVESVSGEDFATYARNHLLQPLGMARSGFVTSAGARSDEQALGYVFARGALQGKREDMSPSGPAGALLATPDDIARFMIAHLEGESGGGAAILSPQSFAIMHRRSAQAGPYLDGMALGFMAGQLNGRHVLRHDGSTQFTHTEMVLFPQQRLGLFLAFNSHEGGFALQDLRRAIVNRYYPAQWPRVAATPGAFERAREYAGYYQSRRRSYSTFEALFGAFPLAVAALPSGQLLVAGARWAEVAPDTFRNDAGEFIAFERAPDRKIVAMDFKTSLVPTDRVSWFGTPGFHLLLILFAIVTALASIVIVARRFRASGEIPAYLCWTRRLNALIGAINIAVIVLLGTVFAGGIGTIMSNGLPASLFLGLWLALASAGLTAIAAVAVLFTIRQKTAPRRAVIAQALFVCGSLILACDLEHWNLLGFHLG